MHVVGEGEAAVRWVAERQHGVVHRSQVERCGLGRTAREGRVARGTWDRLYPHVLAIHPPSWKGTVFAAILDAGPDTVAADLTAAHLDGLAWRPGPHIHLATIGRIHPKARRGVSVHRPRHLTWADVHFHQNIPLTRPHETLASMAAHTDGDELEAMVALALRRGQTTRDRLTTFAAEASRRPGIGALKKAIAHPDLTRSQNERALLRLVRAARLPHPETNVTVGGKELDCYWPDASLGVEMDAFSTHGDSTAFEDDRRTDAALEAAGVRVLRVTARRVRSEPERVVAELAAVLALRLGGLPPPARR